MQSQEELLARLAEHGARRRAALEEAERELDAMRDDLAQAMEQRVPIAELSRIAAVSRPTLYELRRRA
jgi:hypothetical protein